MRHVRKSMRRAIEARERLEDAYRPVMGVSLETSLRSGGASDPTYKAVCRIQAMHDEWVSLASSASVVFGQYRQAVDELDAVEGYVLCLRYIKGMTALAAAAELGVSERHLYTLQKDALRNLYDYLPLAWKIDKE